MAVTATDRIFGVRITAELVKNGVPATHTVTFNTSDSFEARDSGSGSLGVH
jgi:hypothetical protein